MIHVFVGPSYPNLHKKGSLPHNCVSVYPPARRGDLDNLKIDSRDIIALIDGVMVYAFPPSPTEVYNLLGRTSRLFGASSLGALRAAELRKFGMTGYGHIYTHVCSTFAFRDDELVCLYDTEFQYLTVPLINVRFHLQHFKRTGAITNQEALYALEVLSKIHFSERSIETVHKVFDEVRIPYLYESLHSTNGVLDMKNQDAVMLLKMLETTCF